MRALLAALLLAGLAPLALAHGLETLTEKDAGPYHVRFIHYAYVTEGEQVRFAWNVTEKASGQAVRIENASVQHRSYDTRGQLVSQATIPLRQIAPGFVFADFTIGKEGRAVFALPLPQGQGVEFDQEVLPGSTGGQPSTPQGTPLPAGLALLALGIACLATRADRASARAGAPRPPRPPRRRR